MPGKVSLAKQEGAGNGCRPVGVAPFSSPSVAVFLLQYSSCSILPQFKLSSTLCLALCCSFTDCVHGRAPFTGRVSFVGAGAPSKAKQNNSHRQQNCVQCTEGQSVDLLQFAMLTHIVQLKSFLDAKTGPTSISIFLFGHRLFVLLSSCLDITLIKCLESAMSQKSFFVSKF